MHPNQSTQRAAESAGLHALDAITQRLTARSFNTFTELLTAPGNYRPSIHTDKGPEYAILANAYDHAQALRGDTRRAYRG